MKILQILPELNVGGVETGTVDLAKYLKAHGHEPLVVSHGGVLVEELTVSGIRHIQLPVHQKNIVTAWMCVQALVKIIQEENVDIVHARSRVPGWIAYFATQQTQAHFVTTCHGYYSGGFYSSVMGFGKRVIAISQVIARHMIQDFRVPMENIRIIPRSVDVEKFSLPRPKRQPTDPKRIVCIGRLTTLKGHPYFLKAIARVMRTFPHIQVQIIGDAPGHKQAYKEELMALSKRLAIDGVVSFLGNRRDVPELLAQADCLVLPTITQEAFGRVIIEAQAAGVGVVATHVGGVTEVIDHEQTGLLVPPKDDLSMAQAIIRMISDDAFRAQTVANAKKKIADKYTLEKMANSTLDVYDEVMKSMNILIIKLGALGDIVLSTAAFRAIRAKYPHAHIWCLTSADGAVLLERCEDIHSLLVFDYKKKNFSDVWQMGEILRRCRFDLVVDLQNNRISHTLAFLATPKHSYGFDNGKWSFLLKHRIKNDIKLIPPVEHQFRILKLLDISYTPKMSLQLKPSSLDHAHIQKLLDSQWLGHKPMMVGMNLAASVAWPSKNWPINHIIKFADMLAAHNVRLVLTGTTHDLDKAREIVGKSKARPANLVGKTTLMQLAALMSYLKVYITPDSAPLHVAASQDVPLIALFGPTDYRRHLPPAKQIKVLTHPVTCAPCYSGQCKLNQHQCLDGVTPEMLFKNIEEFLIG